VGELIPAGVQTVVLALRLGLCVFKIQELVESSKSVSSWSVLVYGMRESEAQELIQQYAKKNVSVFPKAFEKPPGLIFLRFCLVFHSPISAR
jgi:hypothetical protein